MPRTKADALKRKRKFEKQYPDLKCRIIDDTDKFPKSSSLRYNYRFYKKR